MTFLDTVEDLDWLSDVHNIDTIGFVCAFVYGNEDSPTKVELFIENRWTCPPVVYVQNNDGVLVKEQTQ